ncbi:hypothetical protein BJX61DRAFT_541751 [Aspergillus egyptiacus]|nr:hypothetical protein BJX61DRAFT_541751 [Aspergillus egyptiacus]
MPDATFSWCDWEDEEVENTSNNITQSLAHEKDSLKPHKDSHQPESRVDNMGVGFLGEFGQVFSSLIPQKSDRPSPAIRDYGRGVTDAPAARNMGAFENDIEPSPRANVGELMAKLDSIEYQNGRLIQNRQEMMQEKERIAHDMSRKLRRYEHWITDLEHDLQQRDVMVQSLQEDFVELKEKHQALKEIIFQRQGEALRALASNKMFAPKEDRVVRDELSKLSSKIRLWAKSDSLGGFSDLEAIPVSVKDALISSLDGLCLHNDWDSFIHDTPVSREKLPMIVLQAIISGEVFRQMFAVSFFSFAGLDDDETVPKKSEIQKLHHAMYQGGESEAHIWLSQTLRNPSSSENPLLLSRLQDLCSRRVDSFLNSPAQYLMCRVETAADATQRGHELFSLYITASRLALSVWTQRAYMTCRGHKDLPPFSVESPMLSAHRLHHLDEDDASLDGSQIYLIFQPAILVFGSESAAHYDQHKVWAPAVVLLGKNKA